MQMTIYALTDVIFMEKGKNRGVGPIIGESGRIVSHNDFVVISRFLCRGKRELQTNQFAGINFLVLRRLRISPATVAAHRSRIKDKKIVMQKFNAG